MPNDTPLTDPPPDNPPRAVPLVVCDGHRHRWPEDFQIGDRCNCGLLIALPDDQAGLLIEVRW